MVLNLSIILKFKFSTGAAKFSLIHVWSSVLYLYNQFGYCSLVLLFSYNLARPPPAAALVQSPIATKFMGTLSRKHHSFGLIDYTGYRYC